MMTRRSDDFLPITWHQGLAGLLPKTGYNEETIVAETRTAWTTYMVASCCVHFCLDGKFQRMKAKNFVVCPVPFIGFDFPIIALLSLVRRAVGRQQNLLRFLSTVPCLEGLY